MNSFCIFGDSLARGVVLDPEQQRYVRSKQTFVSLFSQQTGAAGKNYGRFGATVEKGLQIARRNLAEMQAAELTFLEYGGNDADFRWEEISDAPEQVHFPRTPIERFTETYRALIQLVREQGGRPVLLNLPPLCAHQYIAWVSRGRSQEHILKWLGSVGYMYRWHEMYSMEVGRLAYETGTPMMDIRTPFLRQQRLERFFCQDGIHPNEEGHRLIAETMAQALPFLERG